MPAKYTRKNLYQFNIQGYLRQNKHPKKIDINHCAYLLWTEQMSITSFVHFLFNQFSFGKYNRRT